MRKMVRVKFDGDHQAFPWMVRLAKAGNECDISLFQKRGNEWDVPVFLVVISSGSPASGRRAAGLGKRTMQVIQKHLSNRATFRFGKAQLVYTIRDASGCRSFAVEYGYIPTEASELEERGPWLRDVGIFLTVLGLLLTGVQLALGQPPAALIWLPIGFLTLLAYRGLRTRYTVIATEMGRIFVIRDGRHDEVMDELSRRRTAQWRQWYAEVDLDNDPDSEMDKFDWLRERNVISETEYQEAMKTIALHHDLDPESGGDEPLVH